jgi:rod shape-determining protein MreC
MMLDLPSRHRPLALLAVTILVQVLLLAFQIKRDRDVRLVRLWSAELLTPPQHAGRWMIGKVRDTWRGYIDLRHARQENQELRNEVNRLELRNRELESQAAEGQRLAVLLGFRQAHSDVPMLIAEVVGASADPASHTIYINRGSHEGVRRNMAVITPDGVVGKTTEVYPNTAQVLLLTDHESGVGALLASTRSHGVVKGTGEPVARLDYVVNDENVAVGDSVLTSGEDRIFAKDLPIGKVIGTQQGNPFKIIQVQPSARLDRLEEVIVLLTQQEVPSKKEQEASPAPSAPKPATSTPAATKPPATTKLPASPSNAARGTTKPSPQKPPTSTKPATPPPGTNPQ